MANYTEARAKQLKKKREDHLARKGKRTSAMAVIAGGAKKTAPATPTSEIQNKSDGMTTAPNHTSQTPPSNEHQVLPIAEATLKHTSATSVSAGGPKKTVPSTPASKSQIAIDSVNTAPKHTLPTPASNRTQTMSTAKATLKQTSAKSVATGDSRKAVSATPTPPPSTRSNIDSVTVVTPKCTPLTPPSNGTQPVTKVSEAAKPIKPLDTDSHNIKDTALASPLDASLGRSSDLASTTSPAPKDTGLSSSNVSLDRPSALASTLSRNKEAPCGAVLGESSSTDVSPTGPFRLFDLPQELQDSILTFAYTESNFTFIHKREWEIKQVHLRKSTGKPKEDFPPHKVNEWMVSKRYFRAAAKAWVEAQTCFEIVKNQKSMHPHDLFPPIFYYGEEAGLFCEFGRAFAVYLRAGYQHCGAERISQCRKMRFLSCFVCEEFFDTIDRGLVWEVEFTDDELMELLKLESFSLSSSVEELHLQPEPYLCYVETEAQMAMLNVNIANLGRVMRQHRSKDPYADTEILNHGALYLGSEVTYSSPSTNETCPLVKVEVEGKVSTDDHAYKPAYQSPPPPQNNAPMVLQPLRRRTMVELPSRSRQLWLIASPTSHPAQDSRHQEGYLLADERKESCLRSPCLRLLGTLVCQTAFSCSIIMMYMGHIEVALVSAAVACITSILLRMLS